MHWKNGTVQNKIERKLKYLEKTVGTSLRAHAPLQPLI
jgi:hypothetical protein